ncbi:hypothetical protein WN944_011214 [Citrus x changshan-huyou]|uniref:Uncharacterized protein n=1 Tax=Citrus x changshan-huyou TaxID=2935761 RepID=A0AAP0QYK7_9ROSI
MEPNERNWEACQALEILENSTIYMCWNSMEYSRVFARSNVLDLPRSFRNWAKLALLALSQTSHLLLKKIGDYIGQLKKKKLVPDYFQVHEQSLEGCSQHRTRWGTGPG